MNTHILLLVLGVMLVLPGGAAATQNTENVTIYRGEPLDLGQYSFQYLRKHYGEQEEVFQIIRDAGTSERVLESVSGDRLYDAIGQQQSVSPSLSYTITALGRDTDGDTTGLYMELQITSNRSIFSSATMDSSAPDRIIMEQGESTSISLTLTNDGLTNQTFNLTADTDLEVTYGFQGFNISRIQTEPGETLELTAAIHVPENAETRMHTVQLIGRNRSTVGWSVDVEVRGTVAEREMRFDIEQMYAAVNPGERIQIPVSVMNSGEPPLKDVTMDVSGPKDWSISIRPTEIASIEQYDRRRAVLTIEAPPGAKEGDYFIEVSAASSNVAPTTKRIRVNISKESRMGDVGIALMAGSLLLLIIVYNTFRRR